MKNNEKSIGEMAGVMASGGRMALAAKTGSQRQHGVSMYGIEIMAKRNNGGA